jgi:hypothetical protein
MAIFWNVAPCSLIQATEMLTGSIIGVIYQTGATSQNKDNLSREPEFSPIFIDLLYFRCQIPAKHTNPKPTF